MTVLRFVLAVSMWGNSQNGGETPPKTEVKRQESGNCSDFLDTKAKRIGNGRWAVRMVGERNGVRRTLNATAVMDKNGDIHYYTD